MDNEILEVVLNYAKDAGKIAIAEQENLSAHLKPDASYVTHVDLRLSELAFRTLSDVVPENRIVTEEHLDNLHTLSNANELERSELTIFVDPIDGTRNYFHNMPLYGISIGIFRNLQPWLGVVVFPALDELFYCDDQNAYLVSGIFRNQREIKKIDYNGADLNANSVVLLANSFVRKYRWSYEVCTAMVTACVSLNACWPSVGRGVGTILNDHIWDFAGSWPILQRLGFEFRGAETSEIITRYNPDDYHTETLKLNQPVIVSRPEHFAQMRSGIVAGSWAQSAL